MKTTLITLLLIISYSAGALADSVTMMSQIPYAKDAKVRKNILDECTDLGAKVATFTQEFGKKSNVSVVLNKSIDTASAGKVLEVYISDAVSGGNAFIGHRKYVAVTGTLYENGEAIASFAGSRYSGGGAFGGYKGSCSVLGRCTKAIGKDIANWLANPVDGASLGDG